MEHKFSEVTKKLQAMMPSWSRIKYDPESKGAQFLNVFGLQFEDIEAYLQYALENYHIMTADVKQIDLVYRAVLPRSLKETMKIQVIGNDRLLTEMDTLKMFYEGIDNRFLEHKQVYYPNPFYIDWTDNIIYTRYSYGVDNEYPDGKITVRVFNDTEMIFEYDIRQSPHHVWNVFDEFGLLLDLPRIHAERNAEYKERLLNVFLHVPNSTKTGMANALAEELDMRRRVKRVVKDDNTYNLEYTNVFTPSLRKHRTEEVRFSVSDNEDKEVTLMVNDGDINIDGAVQFDFIAGIKLHEFHDKSDAEFQSMLYDIEGRATPVLKYYIEVIKQKVPTMWGEFIWNESFWDVSDEQLSGHGVIPTFQDARFLAWQNFKV